MAAARTRVGRARWSRWAGLGVPHLVAAVLALAGVGEALIVPAPEVRGVEQPVCPADRPRAPLDVVDRAVLRTPGVTHHYPLDRRVGLRDVVGCVDARNLGARLTPRGAVFDGASAIEIPDDDDFSVPADGGLTVLALLDVADWRGRGSRQFVHWLGKIGPGAGGDDVHEWTFRHYVRGGRGQAARRQGRTSFYAFDTDGGLGAGSYFQDGLSRREVLVVGTLDRSGTSIWKNGWWRDSDPLAGYGIEPRGTSAPVRIGDVDADAGSLVGRVRKVAFFDRVLEPGEVLAIAAAVRQLR